MTTRALVWFKRDLRVRDHAPLIQGQNMDSALGLFVIEPQWLSSPECDAQHVQFTLDCLQELRASLAQLGLPLWVAVGEVTQVMHQLHKQFHFTHLLSHEETGPLWTYARDKMVALWAHAHQVKWLETPQTGVVRRLKNRNGWAANWAARMNAPELAQPRGLNGVQVEVPELPNLAQLGLKPSTKTLQSPGEAAAWDTLNSFLQGRGHNYRKALSSPLSAREGCSRLSPHLAFGTLSMRSVHKAAETAIEYAVNPGMRSMAYALRGFTGRLRWHCHFMQKLEDEPAIEHHNFVRACDGLRENDFNRAHFEAWCEGRTGFPMVDACMRSLVATGWLNFRMRAMLVSFASYHLWLHWRETGLHLARQFLDFEPGIHWSQMQMQSGTTGINTLRIYSPSKQALDQDPQGIFMRQWLPEWGTSAYPAPIVDEKVALKIAKDRLYPLRKTPEAKEQAQAVNQKHGSRKSSLPASSSARKKRNVVKTPQSDSSKQLDLFGFDDGIGPTHGA
jgi:deoxyribodipyrimidine photo-lyase